MLIEFSIGNFLSFNKTVTFSMLASDQDSVNAFRADKFQLLKSAVIYGANASGKSNLLKAVSFMTHFVSESSKESQAAEQIDIENFRLSTESENNPSFFEIIFICDKKRYRYGFEVDKDKVHSEWLFFVPKKREAKLFTRVEKDIQTGAYFKEGKGLENRTRPNALFLSVVAQFNGEISVNILKWFRNLNVISGLNTQSYKDITLNQLEDDEFIKRVSKLLKIADLNIQNIKCEITTVTGGSLKEKTLFSAERIRISSQHIKYDKNNRQISLEDFNLNRNESEGTQKIFYISGLLLSTLDNGKILFVDELDARFHPFITRLVVQLFNSVQTNPYNAQLIFVTHDTNLLDPELFRRDQIWFTEKDDYEATALYSLAEYKELKKDTVSIKNNYISGIYGAIPFIGDFERLLGMQR